MSSSLPDQAVFRRAGPPGEYTASSLVRRAHRTRAFLFATATAVRLYPRRFTGRGSRHCVPWAFCLQRQFSRRSAPSPVPPMDQEGAQIGVSSFGDPQKPVLPSLSCCLGARPRYGAKCPLKKLPEIPSFPFQENFEGLPEPSLSSDPGFPKPRSQTGRPGRLIAFPTT